MNEHLFSACESVDACVFSGDSLYEEENRVKLKEYIARWQRAIESCEQILPDLKETP